MNIDTATYEEIKAEYEQNLIPQLEYGGFDSCTGEVLEALFKRALQLLEEKA